MTATIITTRELSKTYPGARGRSGPVEAVRGVDLEVHGGEIVGFLGPNGAGKTTTLRMLTTLLEPTAGEATVNGFDLRRDAVNVRRSIGYVAQAGSSYPLAIVGEEIVDHARLYGVQRSVAVSRTSALFATLDLEGTEKRAVKTLSGGQRRRLDIAMVWSTSRPWSSSTSRRRAWTRSRAPTCGSTSVGCATTWAPRCS